MREGEGGSFWPTLLTSGRKTFRRSLIRRFEAFWINSSIFDVFFVFYNFGGSYPLKCVFLGGGAPTPDHVAHHEGVAVSWCRSPEHLSIYAQRGYKLWFERCSVAELSIFQKNYFLFCRSSCKTPDFATLNADNSTPVVRMATKVAKIESPIKGLHLKHKLYFYQ